MNSRSAGALRYADEFSRWSAVQARDNEADGAFYYSVATTGVYCRPICAARRPHRENVRFHDTAEQAEKAGFRPCKRCRPHSLSPHARNRRIIEQACRAISDSAESPGLARLAESAGMSPFHFHRLFKQVTGVTPKAYASAAQNRRVREALDRGSNVTESIYASGFNSGAGFYASVNDRLGMTPTAYRSGGAGMSIRFALGECSLGSILAAATDRGVCALLLGDEPGVLVKELHSRFPEAKIIAGDSDFESVLAKAVALIENPRVGLDLPLDIRGTAFQVRVWEELRRIPPGATASYSEIAGKIGRPKAVRAVGAACGANSIAVAIPCHRVLRADKSLSGYRWGAGRKAELLKRETEGA